MLAGYGLDVLDPGVSPRRVWALSQRLPPWARRPGEDWSTEAELLALVIDSVADLTWLVAKLGGSTSTPRPRPLPRPASRALAAAPAAAPAPDWGQLVSELGGMTGVAVQGV